MELKNNIRNATLHSVSTASSTPSEIQFAFFCCTLQGVNKLEYGATIPTKIFTSDDIFYEN